MVVLVDDSTIVVLMAVVFVVLALKAVVLGLDLSYWARICRTGLESVVQC